MIQPSAGLLHPVGLDPGRDQSDVRVPGPELPEIVLAHGPEGTVGLHDEGMVLACGNLTDPGRQNENALVAVDLIARTKLSMVISTHAPKGTVTLDVEGMIESGRYALNARRHDHLRSGLVVLVPKPELPIFVSTRAQKGTVLLEEKREIVSRRRIPDPREAIGVAVAWGLVSVAQLSRGISSRKISVLGKAFPVNKNGMPSPDCDLGNPEPRLSEGNPPSVSTDFIVPGVQGKYATTERDSEYTIAKRYRARTAQ